MSHLLQLGLGSLSPVLCDHHHLLPLEPAADCSQPQHHEDLDCCQCQPQ
uniref:Uncharacterized protein n=1 Tax=Arundo donax TaxID=35708 RepID=A0A0A9BEK0_ARUDO